MGENGVKQSWWLTLPGILTAVAGLITAATGLILALNTAGLLHLPISTVPKPISVLPTNAAAPKNNDTTTLSQTPSCEIAGYVYNSDDNKPLAGVRVFVRKGTRAEDWVPLASSGPDGSFQGSCVGFAQTAFPLHLGVTDDQWRCTPADPPFSTDGWEVVQQRGAPNVNLFVSVKGMIRLKIIACRPN